jgi:hypothetical protein
VPRPSRHPLALERETAMRQAPGECGVASRVGLQPRLDELVAPCLFLAHGVVSAKCVPGRLANAQVRAAPKRHTLAFLPRRQSTRETTGYQSIAPGLRERPI